MIISQLKVRDVRFTYLEGCKWGRPGHVIKLPIFYRVLSYIFDGRILFMYHPAY